MVALHARSPFDFAQGSLSLRLKNGNAQDAAGKDRSFESKLCDSPELVCG